MILDVASIIFVCVTMNHLGLVSSMEDVVGFRLPIANCPKCASFWSTLAYGLSCIGLDAIIMVLAMSFLSSYLAIWLELLEGFIDTLYIKCYGKIISTDTDDEVATDAKFGDSSGSLSDM